jgi:hypothetical protein
MTDSPTAFWAGYYAGLRPARLARQELGKPAPGALSLLANHQIRRDLALLKDLHEPTARQAYYDLLLDAAAAPESPWP